MKTTINRLKINEILNFWFEGVNVDQTFGSLTSKWFGGGQIDTEITKKFKQDIQLAKKGQYENWKVDKDGYLAYIVLNDQFPRNCYRRMA